MQAVVLVLLIVKLALNVGGRRNYEQNNEANVLNTDDVNEKTTNK